MRCAGVATAALMIYSAPHKYIAARKRKVEFSYFCLSSYQGFFKPFVVSHIAYPLHSPSVTGSIRLGHRSSGNIC